MTTNLDELYLNYLYGHIADPEIASPSKTYWKLATVLYKKPFLWFVPNDDNRVEDGRYLRLEFVEDLGLNDVEPHWMNLECSMLEMLIGLSRRLSLLDEGEPRVWFWHLISNLDLTLSDRGRFPTARVEEVLDTVIQRTYEPSGHGGLFPLMRANRDQRYVEIWYQLNAYLLENN